MLAVCYSPQQYLNHTDKIGTPLHVKGTPKPAEKDIVRDLITETTIFECIASPHPSDITTILDTLLKTPDVTSCLTLINSIKATQGLALADIITALGEELTKLDVPPAVMKDRLQASKQLREIPRSQHGDHDSDAAGPTWAKPGPVPLRRVVEILGSAFDPLARLRGYMGQAAQRTRSGR